MDAPFSVDFIHRMRFVHDAWSVDEPGLCNLIRAGGDVADRPARVLVFMDQGVRDRWPGLVDQVQAYTRMNRSHMTLAGPVHTVLGGEACKNDRVVVDEILSAIHDAGLCRQSYVIVIGGGAVLDVVGFAAAIAHRGIRLIRFPTTTLAQADSGVGVKNGINHFGKKNYLGTFSPPWAVVNDERFLQTLSDRDWRCGFSEAVKVALAKDAGFFEQIAAAAPRLQQRDAHAAWPIIQRSAQLHLDHITTGGDPFELTLARPLDMGHWSAHKLEQMTGFTLRHGEAVAIGLAIDTTYASLAGLLAPAEADEILEVLSTLGFALHHEVMADAQTLLAGLEEFREHLGGRLTLTLPTGVGQTVDVHQVDRDQLNQSIQQLHQRRAAATATGSPRR